LPGGKHNTPVGAGYSGEPHLFLSADKRHKLLFGKQGNQVKVLNLGHSDFDIVSDFVLCIFSRRDMVHASRNCPIHLARTFCKSARSMQNKPNFQTAQMNANLFFTKHYENQALRRPPENKPKQSQFPPVPIVQYVAKCGPSDYPCVFALVLYNLVLRDSNLRAFSGEFTKWQMHRKQTQ